jgi:hypothetical protein
MQPPCCYFTFYKELLFESVLFFRKSFTIHHSMALLQVALMLIPPHKFVRPPCCYYLLHKIEKYNFRLVPNGITLMPNFIQICPAVLELNHADRQTWPAQYAFISCTLCKERIKLDKKYNLEIFSIKIVTLSVCTKCSSPFSVVHYLIH